jgi:hypothetical protein
MPWARAHCRTREDSGLINSVVTKATSMHHLTPVPLETENHTSEPTVCGLGEPLEPYFRLGDHANASQKDRHWLAHEYFQVKPEADPAKG